ncbi:hypothetical protein K2173_006357 [Erythroxylum novogranatense]|uniref:TPX2 C-terminal domain-containing protein n=1 Tax=Erythroxylum novogranatense TaxID=1862640 RepID=A0AAV8U331_9ROSI|nr:hypothetical protein K2173_006357 [Erythroxylum novogranatense]
MSEAATSNPALQVSVSFGRFESDSLSWEKWSSFSPNKYLEEVEKCATPGSVAQKKAYFEAHYKKIAARKAELVDQEKQMGHDSLRSDDQSNGDLIDKTCRTEFELEKFTGRTSAEAVEKETESSSDLDIARGEYAIFAEAHDSSTVVVKELGSKLDMPEVEKPEEAPNLKEPENQQLESPDRKELHKSSEKQMESITTNKGKTVRLDRRKESRKSTSISKGRDMATVKKKPPLLVTRPPQTFTPKPSKPVFASSAMSASTTSTKKSINSSISKSRVPSAGESKSMAPKTLHMSLSLDCPGSNQSPHTATRKSLIMEKMGDKDIVKRVFKTFQNSFTQFKSSSEDRSLGAKQMLTKGAATKVSTSLNPRKGNGGPPKAGIMDRKTAKGFPFLGLTNGERTVRSKEEDKEVETRKLRQSPNFNATRLPSSYRIHKVSKSPLDKVCHVLSCFCHTCTPKGHASMTSPLLCPLFILNL